MGSLDKRRGSPSPDSQLTPSETLVAVLVPIAAVCLVLALYAWRNREQPGATAFVAMMVAVAGLALTNLGEDLSPTMALKMFWNDLSYAPIVLMTLGFFIFAVQYTGRQRWLSRRNMALLWALPVAAMAMVWTNGMHHLYYTSVTVAYYQDFSYLVRDYGIGAYVWIAYAYALMLAGSLLLIGLFFGTPREMRGQIGIVALGAVVGWAGNLVYLCWNPYPFIDMTVISVFLSGALTFVGMYRYRLFDILPMARMVVIDNMRQGVMVIDRRGRVVDANPALLSILGSGEREVIDRRYEEAFSAWPELSEALREDAAPRSLTKAGPEGQRYYELRSCGIAQKGMPHEGRLIVLEDVSEKVAAERELGMAREKLEMMNAITRHDILNRVMVMRGYAVLLDDWAQEGKPRDYLSKIVQAADAAQKIIRFAKEYQEEKVHQFAWNSPGSMIARASESLDVPVRMDTSLERLEVYSDPLLEKVFFNIVENAVRHGGEVTCVTAHAEREEDHMSIFLEDDGMGIPREEKENIFAPRRGNAGHGLFYSREMVKVMGFTISENGVPGRGARFEIQIPHQLCRFQGAQGHEAG